MKEECEILKCTRCERDLTSTDIIWLELSNTDDRFYEKLPEGHESQGGFPFGKTCSKVELQHLGDS